MVAIIPDDAPSSSSSMTTTTAAGAPRPQAVVAAVTSNFAVAKIVEDEAHVRMTLDLPGVVASNLRVELLGSVLQITGVRYTLLPIITTLVGGRFQFRQEHKFCRRYAIDVNRVDVSQLQAHLVTGTSRRTGRPKTRLVLLAPKIPAPVVIPMEDEVVEQAVEQEQANLEALLDAPSATAVVTSTTTAEEEANEEVAAAAPVTTTTAVAALPTANSDEDDDADQHQDDSDATIPKVVSMESTAEASTSTASQAAAAKPNNKPVKAAKRNTTFKASSRLLRSQQRIMTRRSANRKGRPPTSSYSIKYHLLATVRTK